jgi:DNA-binding LacI/PurR family transcriptional regulator
VAALIALRDLGRIAAERLLAAIEGQFSAGVERLPCSLVLRESSRPRTQAPIPALGEPAS